MAEAAENTTRSLGSCLGTLVSLAVICLCAMFLLLMFGMARGETALEDGDEPYRLSIDVADGPFGRVVRFGEEDVDGLKLVRADHYLDPYDHGTTHLWVHTGWTNDEMDDGYCFADPVSIVGPKGKATLIEPGECVGASGRLDRRAVQVVTPLEDALVGESIEVDVLVDPDLRSHLDSSTLRFLVNGEVVTETSGYASTGTVLDLSHVGPGPMTLRVELETPRRSPPQGATVVDLVREPPG